MSDFKEQLQEYEQMWQDAPEGDTFENLPDGKYQVSIQEVRFENAKTSGRLQLAWVFQVESGQHKGRKVFHYRGLDKEESVGWMKKEVARCGLKVEQITDLPDKLEELLFRIIEITLKTKKNNGEEFQNCFINKLLEEPAEGSYVAANEDDTIPF